MYTVQLWCTLFIKKLTLNSATNGGHFVCLALADILIWRYCIGKKRRRKGTAINGYCSSEVSFFFTIKINFYFIAFLDRGLGRIQYRLRMTYNKVPRVFRNCTYSKSLLMLFKRIQRFENKNSLLMAHSTLSEKPMPISCFMQECRKALVE
jgi:hypothetical protein